MTPGASSQYFFGLFARSLDPSGVVQLARHPQPPPTIPDPGTGRPLKIATLEAGARAICPSCTATGHGGFVSFHGDLRLAYACPSCEQLVWLPGA
jgi:hypothetical protein